MWAAHLQQVFTENPQEQEYDCWVLLLRHGSGTKKEEAVRAKHEDIDKILTAQNVNYTEITTHRGKQTVYDKFNCMYGKHPLFLILNKNPVAYGIGDPLMIIEWGKWTDIENLKDDLMALVNFFSNKKFRKSVVDAKNPGMWKRVGDFLEDHGISVFKIGATIVAALT